MEIETRIKISSTYDGGVIVQFLDHKEITEERICSNDVEAMLAVCEFRGLRVEDLINYVKKPNKV